MTILVTGGTGDLGRLVVRRLIDAGERVVCMSRKPRPRDDRAYEWATADLKTGEGLETAVAGASVIVHCATSGMKADVAQTGRLLAAVHAAGTKPHIIYISIVGVDRIPFRYYRAKLSVENMVEQSGLPWTILRATQFHELVVRLGRALGRSPVVPVLARTSFQPIDGDEVAARLAELAKGPAQQWVPDMGGPRVVPMKELLAGYFAAVGKKRLLLPIFLPGRNGKAFREGRHHSPNAVGHRTFEEFLAKQVRPAGPASSP